MMSAADVIKAETTEYKEGSLSQLISNKSKTKKKSKLTSSTIPVTESADTKSADTKSAVTGSTDNKLENIFNDPTASDYSVKQQTSTADVEVKVEAESDGDEDKSVKDRKEVREKSKLLKLRRREKDETSDRTVFIGNLHTNTTKKDLLNFFKKYGKIESVRFRNLMRKDLKKPMKASAIKRDLHPLAKSMNAYIQFSEVKCATRALKRNGKELLGSHIRVDIAATHSDHTHDRKISVFIGNVPFDAHEEELRSHFSKCGEVVNVRLIRDKETRLGKGFGYVQFKSPDGVHLALQMDGDKYGKNKLRVQRCIQTNKPDSNNTTSQSAGSSSTATKRKSWSGTTSNSNEKAEPAAKKSLPEKAEKLKKKPRHEIRHDRNKMPIKQPQKISAVTKTSAVAKKPHYNKISKVKKTAKLVKK